MATRSRIAVKQQDGTIKSIYCHWDGYPLHNGAILLEHYTREKADMLMEVGDIRVLDAKSEYDIFDSEGKHHNDFDSFLEDAFSMGEEYVYVLMEDDQWYCFEQEGKVKHTLKDIV
jgi:hypothetical protein